MSVRMGADFGSKSLEEGDAEGAAAAAVWGDEAEALASACRRFFSCGKIIAIGCVISEDACTQRLDTMLHDL